MTKCGPKLTASHNHNSNLQQSYFTSQKNSLPKYSSQHVFLLTMPKFWSPLYGKLNCVDPDGGSQTSPVLPGPDPLQFFSALVDQPYSNPLHLHPPPPPRPPLPHIEAALTPPFRLHFASWPTTPLALVWSKNFKHLLISSFFIQQNRWWHTLWAKCDPNRFNMSVLTASQIWKFFLVNQSRPNVSTCGGVQLPPYVTNHSC